MKILVFIIITFLFSCNSSKNNNPDMEKLQKAKVISTFRSTSDMNDSHFSLKEGNYFEFYKSLYDSVKNTVYGGTYITNGDTITLNFFDNDGEEILGKKAIINKETNKIYFFDASNQAKQMNLFN